MADSQIKIKVLLDDGKAQEGIKSLDENSSKLGDTLKGGLAAGAKVAAATLIAIGAAGAFAIKSVMDAYGALEQSRGGAEAVFGDLFSSVEQKANDAYINMGMTANQYYETINKMGSLMQGAGMDQAKAFDLSSAAMQRASDVAAVMGISTEDAMEAIAGAAKGNFTMMDNLGVAMNQTSLEAYAMNHQTELAAAGFEHLSVKEMDNAEKTQLAMMLFMEATEQYDGHFAEEASTTITGSLGMVQASLGNLVAGFGDADADMTALSKQFSDAVVTFIGNLQPMIENIAKALPDTIKTLVPALLSMVMAMLPSLLDTGVSLITAIIDGIVKQAPLILRVMMNALEKLALALLQQLPMLMDIGVKLICGLIGGMADGLVELIPAIISALMGMVQAIIDNLPLFIEAGLTLIENLIIGLVEAIPQLVEQIPVLIQAILDALTEAIPMIIDSGVTLLMALVDNLPAIIEGIVEAIPQIIDALVNFFTGPALPLIIQAGIKLLVALIQALPQIIMTIVKALPQIISAIVGGIIGAIPQLIQAGIELLCSLVTGIGQVLVTIGKAIQDIWNGIAKEISTWPSRLVTAGKNLIDGLVRGIGNAAGAVWDKIVEICSGALNAIKSFFGIASPSKVMAQMGMFMGQGLKAGIEESFTDAMDTMQDILSSDLDLPVIAISAPEIQTANIDWSSTGGVFNRPAALGIEQVGSESGAPGSRQGFAPFAAALEALMGNGETSTTNTYVIENIQYLPDSAIAGYMDRLFDEVSRRKRMGVVA